jgi:hypothetical protein
MCRKIIEAELPSFNKLSMKRRKRNKICFLFYFLSIYFVKEKARDSFTQGVDDKKYSYATPMFRDIYKKVFKKISTATEFKLVNETHTDPERTLML